MRRLDQIALSPNDRQAVERASELLRRQFPVERVILYGSKATGHDDAESDIDLLVVSTRPMSQAEKAKVVQSLFDLQMELGVVLSPLVVNAADWDTGLLQVLPIHAEVDRDGVAA